ncbi:hypothetical protein [Bacillus thuringiensis]|uniref:hypothetical protein n=1 Tax=Bacillus thuringiensis TaxID=1428 RepID=UPI00111240B8|nr:hypothetical protein [Bacillus thuringiensis]QCY65040.1 hypothetical protein FHE73_30770 [Bacillus thuringiensis]
MDKTQNQPRPITRGSANFTIQMMEAARLAIGLGMSVGESSEAARIMAQDVATPEQRQKERKAQHREFVKFHNRKRGGSK